MHDDPQKQGEHSIPVLSPTELDVHFSPGNSWERNGGRDQTRAFAQAFCDSVQLPYPGEFRLLDIGCALGEAIEVIAAKYPNARLSGSDVSEMAVRRATEKNGNLATFFNANVNAIPGQYEVIYISNVLEHFPNYEEIAGKLLRQCERLCIMVPYRENVAAPTPQQLRDNPDRYFQEHIGVFDDQSFDFLREQGLASRIDTYHHSLPGAWGWTPARRLVHTMVYNPVKRVLGRLTRNEPIQVLYDIHSAVAGAASGE